MPMPPITPPILHAAIGVLIRDTAAARYFYSADIFASFTFMPPVRLRVAMIFAAKILLMPLTPLRHFHFFDASLSITLPMPFSADV